MSIFGKAFSAPEPPGADALEAEEELFKRLARQVVSRGLTTPAILFLEAHRPLSFVAGQFLHALGPLAGLLVEERDVERLAESLCRRDGVERLVRSIEDEEARRHRDTESEVR